MTINETLIHEKVQNLHIANQGLSYKDKHLSKINLGI
jgi:hypothetical protein